MERADSSVQLYRIAVGVVMAKRFFGMLVEILAVYEGHGVLGRWLHGHARPHKENPAGGRFRPSPTGG